MNIGNKITFVFIARQQNKLEPKLILVLNH